MDIKTMLLFALAAAALTLLSARLMALSLPIGARVAINAALGLAALFLVNATNSATGLAPGFGFLNTAAAVILGIPGLGLYFLIQWIFT